jgi:hypothetical protein
VAQIKRESSLEWLEREAERLRERAETWHENKGSMEPIRVSRQSGGKGKRDRSREIHYFVRSMVNIMDLCCGKPRHHAVAALTNIAFRRAEIDAEDVRSFCRPTTRAERRPKK